MIISSGHVALTRQQYLKAIANLETHKEELTQLKVCSFGMLNYLF